MTVEIKKRFRLRPVGFRFDAMALFLMCQYHGVDLNEMDKIAEGVFLKTWIWSAHRSYCVENRRKPLTILKMNRFIENLKKSQWDLLINTMVAAREKDNDDKKKAQHGGSSLSQDGGQE